MNLIDTSTHKIKFYFHKLFIGLIGPSQYFGVSQYYDTDRYFYVYFHSFTTSLHT